VQYEGHRYLKISFAPILDFFLNCYSLWINEYLLGIVFLIQLKLRMRGVASAHTKSAKVFCKISQIFFSKNIVLESFLHVLKLLFFICAF